jgi:hypothetical protein
MKIPKRERLKGEITRRICNQDIALRHSNYGSKEPALKHQVLDD